MISGCSAALGAQILNLESVARRPQLPVDWEQIADHLRTIRGVESGALAAWPLMSDETANSAISTRCVVSNVFADRFMVSDGWFREMKISLLSGRDFRVGEASPGPVISDRALSQSHDCRLYAHVDATSEFVRQRWGKFLEPIPDA